MVAILFLLAWDRLPACQLLHDLGSEMLMVAILFLLMPGQARSQSHVPLFCCPLIYTPEMILPKRPGWGG